MASSAGREFPTYGVPIGHAPKLEKFEVHEDLMAAGVLTVYDINSGHVLPLLLLVLLVLLLVFEG